MRRLAVLLLAALAALPSSRRRPRRPRDAAVGRDPASERTAADADGLQTPVASYPFALAVVPGGTRLVVASTGAYDQSLQLLDAKTGKLLDSVPVRRSWLGLALSPDGRARLPRGREGEEGPRLPDRERQVRRGGADLRHDARGRRRRTRSRPASRSRRTGSASWSRGSSRTTSSKIDLATKKVVAVGPRREHPYRPGLLPGRKDPGRDELGRGVGDARRPGEGDGCRDDPDRRPSHRRRLLAPTAEPLFVAEANRNRVAAIDVAAGQVVRQIAVGARPGRPGNALGRDAARRLDAERARARARTGRRSSSRTRTTTRWPSSRSGRTSPRPARPASSRAAGTRPRSDSSPDGKTLYVANAKGSRLAAEREGRARFRRSRRRGFRRGTSQRMPGSVSHRLRPVEEGARVAHAPGVREPEAGGARRNRRRVRRPSSRRSPGVTSPIRHVVYVIRENRTYDQVLGDLPKGNGDPSLVLFGRDVTPNAHALAEEFVLLDNFYARRGGLGRRPQLVDGGLRDRLRREGLASRLRRKRLVVRLRRGRAERRADGGLSLGRRGAAGVSLRNYGEFIGIGAESPRRGVHGTIRGEGRRTSRPSPAPSIPASTSRSRDNARVDLWLKEFREFEKKGEMPRLQIVRLGNDHTAGTKKGALTPRAYRRRQRPRPRAARGGALEVEVLEGDGGLRRGGRRPERLRPRRLAPDGRLVVSPYTRRGGAVDSTMYSTTSMLRTMELILGLPPMSQHDAAATPMSNAFSETPDPTPFRTAPRRCRSTRRTRTAPRCRRLVGDVGLLAGKTPLPTSL